MSKKIKGVKYFEAVGRRKEAVARIRMYITTDKKKEIIINNDRIKNLKVKQGEIYINGKQVDKYFPLLSQKKRYLLPLRICDSMNRFAISVLIKGGGINGQLDAFIHSLSRALEKVDKETYRPLLKKEGLLTRDPRVRERRKVGTGGKARRKQQSPKR